MGGVTTNVCVPHCNIHYFREKLIGSSCRCGAKTYRPMPYERPQCDPRASVEINQCNDSLGYHYFESTSYGSACQCGERFYSGDVDYTPSDECDIDMGVHRFLIERKYCFCRSRVAVFGSVQPTLSQDKEALETLRDTILGDDSPDISNEALMVRAKLIMRALASYQAETPPPVEPDKLVQITALCRISMQIAENPIRRILNQDLVDAIAVFAGAILEIIDGEGVANG